MTVRVEPAFPTLVPVTRPTCEIDVELISSMRRILESRIITNATEVRAFEDAAAHYLGVPNVIAVSSCTSGLMLVLRCLAISGEAILPSFTFMASGHAAIWAGLKPVLADCDRDTYNLDPAAAESVARVASSVVLATHVFGSPCDAAGLAGLGLPVVYDAAHAFGSRYPSGPAVGANGMAEIFSLSPTKPLTAMEGGLIATRDDDFARELRIARNYGNRGDYNGVFAGLSARMAEVNALVGRLNLRRLNERLDHRRILVERYQKLLGGVSGLGFQQVNGLSVNKDFTIRVEAEFGLTRDELRAALAKDNIDTRSYFDPPLHQQTAFSSSITGRGSLENTERLSRSLLTLPLYSDMALDTVSLICEVITEIHSRGTGH